MEKFCIKLAERIISIECIYSSTKTFVKDYLCQAEKPDFEVAVSQSDIDFERQKSAAEDEKEGIPTRHFEDPYLETLAVYRKIANRMIDYDILLFHGSVIAVDGAGYLFTAKSGTGKSTHTRLWREMLGEKTCMVNDDKPLIRLADGRAYVYGTPWDGKHRLSTNTSVPLKAICALGRAENNHIEKVDAREVYPLIVQQTYRNSDPVAMMKTLKLIDRLIESTDIYKLGCNMDPEAAKVAYEGMKGN